MPSVKIHFSTFIFFIYTFRLCNVMLLPIFFMGEFISTNTEWDLFHIDNNFYVQRDLTNIVKCSFISHAFFHSFFLCLQRIDVKNSLQWNKGSSEGRSRKAFWNIVLQEKWWVDKRFFINNETLYTYYAAASIICQWYKFSTVSMLRHFFLEKYIHSKRKNYDITFHYKL